MQPMNTKKKKGTNGRIKGVNEKRENMNNVLCGI